MNIYEFSYPEGETDWVFAPDEERAIEFYLAFTECGDLRLVKVAEVPWEKWSEMYILDPNESEPNGGDCDEKEYFAGLKIIETFEDYAKGNTITDLIATTEF